jgi:acyl dehydratase
MTCSVNTDTVSSNVSGSPSANSYRQIILSGILHGTGMAFLSVDLKIPNPVHIGDTLTVAIEVIDRRETKKPDRGIVTFRHRLSNQEGSEVVVYTVKRMIRRRT